LVPLPRPQLPPTTITIPGPGPSEPRIPESHSVSTPADVTPATKPVPTVLSSPTTSRDVDASSDHDDEDDGPPAAADPYSNLGGAFGNYLQNEPRPMAAGSQRANRHGDLDDLLF